MRSKTLLWASALILCVGCIRMAQPVTPAGDVDQVTIQTSQAFLSALGDVFENLEQGDLSDSAATNSRAKELVKQALGDAFDPLANYQSSRIGGEAWSPSAARSCFSDLKNSFRRRVVK